MKHLSLPPLNIVALTSYTDKKTIDRCKQIGFTKVIHKPMNFQELKKLVGIHYFNLSE